MMVPSMSRFLLGILLGAIVCSAAAVPSRPSLSQILRRKASGSRVGTAATTGGVEDSYDAYGIETKEICLQEIEQKYCDVDYDGEGAGYFWTSDFVCCQDDNNRDNPSGVPGRNNFIWSAQNNAIGSCDWAIFYTDYVDLTYNIYKAGYAWATCYFGPEAEQCGGPLCDRLVMSLQGTAYYSDYVYTYWGEAYTDGNCDYIYPAALPNGTRADGASHRSAVSNKSDATNKRASNKAAHKKTKNQGSRKNRNTKASPGGAQLAYNTHNWSEDVNREVYEGEATIIMGIISAMAGQRKDRWEEGVFEYVPYYSYSDTVTEGIDASYPWIRDKTYQMTFFRHASKY